MQEHDTNATTIAALNDRFRQTYWGGQVLVTDEVSALSELTRIELFRSVQLYDNFVQDNDPYGEHDFGKVVIDGQDFFWKIDLHEELPVKRFNDNFSGDTYLKDDMSSSMWALTVCLFWKWCASLSESPTIFSDLEVVLDRRWNRAS